MKNSDSDEMGDSVTLLPQLLSSNTCHLPKIDTRWLKYSR